MNFTGSLSHCFSFTGKRHLDSAKESFMSIQVSLTCLVDCKPNYTSRTSYFSHQTKMPEKEGSSTLEQLYHFHVDYSNEEIDYNIFIGPESDHCLPLSLTHSLTN